MLDLIKMEKEHDVIKVEHFGDLDEVTTIITYREDKK